MKPTILFMGTPELALIVLKKIHGAAYPIVGVVCQPDKPSGRGQKITISPVAQYALEHHLPLFQPANLKDEVGIKQIRDTGPDFIVVMAYGNYLPQGLLSLAKNDILNIHPSLLPKYRGAAPINWAILNGEIQTGVTLMRPTSLMDAGPIFAQVAADILPNDTAQTLGERLVQLGADLLLKTLPKIILGKISPQNQDDRQASLAPKLEKDFGQMDWTKSNLNLHNQVRGLQPWPGAYSCVDKKRLKIYDTMALDEISGEKPGTIYLISQQGIHVACGQGGLLIKVAQVEGRNKMNAYELAKGLRLKVGDKLSLPF